MRAIWHSPKDNVAAVDEEVEARVDDDEEVVDGDHVARPVGKVCKKKIFQPWNPFPFPKEIPTGGAVRIKKWEQWREPCLSPLFHFLSETFSACKLTVTAQRKEGEYRAWLKGFGQVW